MDPPSPSLVAVRPNPWGGFYYLRTCDLQPCDRMNSYSMLNASIRSMFSPIKSGTSDALHDHGYI